MKKINSLLEYVKMEMASENSPSNIQNDTVLDTEPYKILPLREKRGLEQGGFKKASILNIKMNFLKNLFKNLLEQKIEINKFSS